MSPAKTARLCGLAAILSIANLAVGADAAKNQPATTEIERLPPEFASTLSRFAIEKSNLVESIAKDRSIAVPRQVREFFAVAQKDDWIGASNRFVSLLSDVYPRAQRRLPDPLWGAVHDVYGTYEIFRDWHPKFATQFATETVGAIPPGSIYFGGSEAGRFLVSAFSQSHSEGRPFFTLTQNALSEGAYAEYLRAMYGPKLQLPDASLIQKCTDEYTEDAKLRLEHDQKFPQQPPQIRRAEDVRFVDGKLQIGGPISVMAIHALIVKEIFNRHPDREFFIEESYPLEWTYAHASPHHFIFKINRDPLRELSDDVIHADQQFWMKNIETWLGPWLKTNTPLQEIADFAKKTYSAEPSRNADADPLFAKDLHARKAFSNLRASQAALYSWRAKHGLSVERARMKKEAEFAYRQALAICPTNPKAVFLYAETLQANNQPADALLVAQTAKGLDPANPQFRSLVEQLSQRREPPIKPPSTDKR
jgi:hypothetical protein